MTLPDWTVVVMTRDRLPDLLATVPHHEGPVLVVDNGSSDGTSEALRLRRRRDPAWAQVQVLPLGRNHGAVARSVGARAVGTELVAFADDDSWWAPGALSRAAQVFHDHPRLGLLAGRVLVGPQEEPDPVDALLAEAPLGQADDLPGPHVMGFLACGAVVRRSAFLQVGGFDEVVFFRGEEERVVLDLTAAGWGCAYVPEVVAHHHPSPRRAGSPDSLGPRNSLLTAVMRRPWPVVADRAVRVLRSGPAGRRGLLQAVPRLPGALGARRRLPAEVEDMVRRCEAAGS